MVASRSTDGRPCSKRTPIRSARLDGGHDGRRVQQRLRGDRVGQRAVAAEAAALDHRDAGARARPPFPQRHTPQGRHRGSRSACPQSTRRGSGETTGAAARAVAARACAWRGRRTGASVRPAATRSGRRRGMCLRAGPPRGAGTGEGLPPPPPPPPPSSGGALVPAELLPLVLLRAHDAGRGSTRCRRRALSVRTSGRGTRSHRTRHRQPSARRRGKSRIPGESVSQGLFQGGGVRPDME